jgi:hypothetical protein
MTIGICIYYCLMEDPIPLSVLLRYMFSPEDPEDTAEYPNIYNLTQQRPVIQSKLIIRRVLQIDDIVDDDTKKELLYPRRHPFPIQVSTDHKCLHFSEPLVTIEENEDGNNTATADKGGGNNNSSSPPPQRPIESLPHYQRPYTITDEEEQASSSLPTRQQQRVADNHDHNVENPPDTTRTNGPEQLRAIDDDNHEVDDDDYFGIHHDTRDRGTACDICLLDYQVGDDVAWSPNLDCSHAFHNDCILDWLVRKPTCPNCRHDFLKGKPEDV